MAISLQHRDPGEQRNSVLPPWLWFWLAVYILEFPAVFDRIKVNLLILFTGKDGVNPWTYDALERVFPVGEILLDLVLSVGILMIFLPWIRTVFLQRKYGLIEPQFLPSEEMPQETLQTLNAVSQFVRVYAPNIILTYNASGERLLDKALVYPVGYRRTGMAVSGRLLALWNTDRQAAEGVLLHEIEHYRHGDKFVIGAGSFLEAIVKRCFLLTMILGAVPLVISLLVEHITAIREEMAVTTNLSTIVSYHFQQVFVMDIPFTFLFILQLFFWAASLFIIVVVAIWCAEINADRFAIDTMQSTRALARTVEQHAASSSLWDWLWSGIHHPPAKLRRWLVRQSEGTRGLTLLLLFFPVVWFIRLLFLLGWALADYLTFLYTGTSTGYILGKLVIDTEYYLETTVPVWVAMAVLVALWPILTRYWERFFANPAGRPANASYHAYLSSAGFIVSVCLIGIVLSLLPPPQEPAGLRPAVPYSTATTLNGHFKVGDTVTIGELWTVTVQNVQVRSDILGAHASAGHEFLVINVSLKNISAQTNTLSDSQQFTLRDLNGVSYDDTYITEPLPPAVAQNGNVPAGATAQGPLTYVDVPVSVSQFTLSFKADWKNADSSQVTVWDIIISPNGASTATSVPVAAPTPTPASTPKLASTPAPTPTPAPTAMPTPTPTPMPTFPTLQASYAGTLVNITNNLNVSASATMSSIVEDQKGEFAGTMTIQLPLAGSGVFTGTVSSDGTIQFTVVPTDGSGYAAIVFTGTFHADGSMSGTYTLPGTSPAQGGTWQFQPA